MLWWAGVALAVVLAATSVRTGLDGRDRYRASRRALSTAALAIPADVSRPGTHAGRFEHVLGGACSSSIWVDRADLPGGDPAALEGLAARLVVRDPAGTVIAESPLLVHAGDAFEGVRLGELPTHLPLGTYATRVTVDAPAASAGAVTVRAAYRPCGLEVLPAYACFAVAAVSGLFSAAITVAMTASWWAGRRVRDRPGAAGPAGA